MATRKTFKRTEKRPITRGDTFIVTPTAVSAGSPGAWTPATQAPNNLTQLRSLGALGQTVAWTVGQHVILDDTTHAYWDGDSWEAGNAPA